jgi:hypothetical protein
LPLCSSYFPLGVSQLFGHNHHQLHASHHALKYPSRRPSGNARIGGFPRAKLGRGKRRLKISPVACVEKSWETRHNCIVPSLSAVTAPLTSHQPLSPMDASPAPSPPSPSFPVPRPPARTLIIIDCDPEDLGRAAAPIGPPAELALRRPLPYAMMHARAPTRALTAAATAEGDRAADLPTGRFEPPSPPLRFDPLLPIDPRRLVEINTGAPGDSRETATVVHPSQKRRVELSCFAPYPLPSSGVRIEPMAPPPPSPAVAPTPAPSPTSATPPPRSQQVFPAPSPRGMFSHPHGLNPRLTRVF